MRHNKKHGMKLGTDASHTKAMKKSLTSALLANDRIKTTQPRAKAIRTDVDRVITWAKKGDLHSAVSLSRSSATRSSSARSSRRPHRACGKAATAATPAS